VWNTFVLSFKKTFCAQSWFGFVFVLIIEFYGNKYHLANAKKTKKFQVALECEE